MRRIAGIVATAVLAAPAVAHAANHQGATPSATPLIVELAAAALILTLVIVRRPLARLVRATFRRLAQRRAGERVTRPARFGGQ